MVKGAAGELAPTILDLRRKGYSSREIAQTLRTRGTRVQSCLPPLLAPQIAWKHTRGSPTRETPRKQRGEQPRPSRWKLGKQWKHLGNTWKHLETFPETPWKHTETAGNTMETLGNTPPHSGDGGKHQGNTWKQLETLGNAPGSTGGGAADTPTAVGGDAGGAPQPVGEGEGGVLWR